MVLVPSCSKFLLFLCSLGPTTKGQASGTFTLRPTQAPLPTQAGVAHVGKEALCFQMTEVPPYWYFLVRRTSLDTSVEVFSYREKKRVKDRIRTVERKEKKTGPPFFQQRCYYLSPLQTWASL